MRKSRSQTAETRARIVSVASRVLLARGLDSVGMRDVMEAADLTAGGFYRHFSSKDQLIEEAIQDAFDRLFAMFQQVTLGQSRAQSLERIVTLYLEQSPDKSRDTTPYLCPMAQLGSELANSSPAIRAVASGGHKRLVALIAGCLSDLPGQDITVRANAVVSLLVGAVTTAKFEPHPRTASLILSRAKQVIMDLP